MKIKIQTSTKEKLITTIVLVISLFVFSMIVPFLKLRFLTQFFPLIYACICCYYLMTYIVNSYTYTFSDKSVMIEKTTGRKTVTVIELSYKNILCVSKNPVKASNLTVSPFNKNCLYLTYTEGKTEKSVKIHCDDAVNSAFKEKIGDKFHE